ncbi:MAG TPA: DUF2155 domain-containing protein [Xanthobacteraceae bacterium]|nr:DUF2155 domain-containing protein [Xanthobacteraceae bacterium]
MHRPYVLAVLAAVIAVPIGAVPAAAQFGSIFDPPRPPTDVPNRPPASPPPNSYPQPAPSGFQPPAPGRSGIQSQPLPPPPGATAAPPTQPAPQPSTFAPPAPGQAPPAQPPAPPGAPLQPGDEIITAPPAQKVVNPTAVFSGLDKITGRITTFEAAINETVQFGALRVTPRACYTRPPNETPNTDSFLEVDEITLSGEVHRIFTGWMYAASPGLHAVEHPIYDVWLTDCKGGDATAVAGAKPPEPEPTPPPAPRTQTKKK